MSKVYFIGAGPGDPELVTRKGWRLIGEADLVVYAGSLVPAAVVAQTKPGARVVDSSPLTLEETHALLLETVRAGNLAIRVHTGDPALYGAIREQMALLVRDGIDFEVVPGVTAAFAAAAAARRSLTVPGQTQAVVLARKEGRTPVPERESLRELARHGSAMAVYLSAGDPAAVQAELLEGGYGPDTLVVVALRVGWPDGRVVETTLGRLAETAGAMELSRQTVFLILPGQETEGRSKLYDKAFSHGFRAAGPGEDEHG